METVRGKLDETALLAGVDGDRRILRELVRLFLSDYPKRLADMREAVRRGDAGLLEKAAHALKGSVGNFGAKSAIAVAQQLESLASKGNLDIAPDLCVTLESELALLSEELRKLTVVKKPRSK